MAEDIYAKFIQEAFKKREKEDIESLKKKIESLENKIKEITSKYESIIKEKDKYIEQLKKEERVVNTEEDYQNEVFTEIEEMVLGEDGKEIGPIKEFL